MNEATTTPSSISKRFRIRGVSRNVLVLGWVSLLTDLASEMLYPLLPLFLVGTLGASTALLGVIDGVAEGGSTILRWSPSRGYEYMPMPPERNQGLGINRGTWALYNVATGISEGRGVRVRQSRVEMV